MYEQFGVSSIEAVNNLPGPNLEDELMPDMASLPTPPEAGIGIQERKDQLRYLTDEKGGFVLDGRGNKIPRGSYELRIYVTDENGPIGLKKENMWLKTTPELIDIIMEAEKNIGIVTSKTKAKKQQAEKPKKERNMARVILNRVRGAKSPPPGGADEKVEKPLTGKARKGNGEPQDLPKEIQEQAAAPADLGPVMEVLESLSEAMAAVKKDLDALRKKVDKDNKGLSEAIASAKTATIDCSTIFHDVYMVQVGNEAACCSPEGLNIITAYPTEEGNE